MMPTKSTSINFCMGTSSRCRSYRQVVLRCLSTGQDPGPRLPERRDVAGTLSDAEREAGVRIAERGLDGVGAVGARDDETEVLPAFGKRHELLPDVGRDGDVLH